MTRILAIDYGDKNIGIAISDALGYTAQGIEIIRRSDGNSFKKPILRIRELIKEYGIGLIVLGYPKNMDNSIGERCIKTEEFRDRLKRNFKSMEVVLWDERLSSAGAQTGLDLAGMSRQDQKEIIDKMAAVYILQGYLDYRSNQREFGRC